MTKPSREAALAPANAVDVKGRGCRRPELPGMRRVWPADALGLACGTGYLSGADVTSRSCGLYPLRGADKARSPGPIFSRRSRRLAL